MGIIEPRLPDNVIRLTITPSYQVPTDNTSYVSGWATNCTTYYSCFWEREKKYNPKPPPFWLDLFKAIEKFVERKESFRKDTKVRRYDLGKRGYIPNWLWTVKRPFDVIVV